MSTCTSNSTVQHHFASHEPYPEDKLKLKAKLELNETEEIKEESLQQLKKLIKEHNLRSITRDDFLLRFLRSRRFQVQKSFEAVQEYCKQRISLHPWFSNLREEAMITCLRKLIFGILPYRDLKGRLVFYIRSGIWKKEMCTDEEFAASLSLLLNYLAEDESVQVNGISFLLDERKFHLPDVFYVMRQAGVVGNFIFQALPGKCGIGNIINEPVHYRMFYKLLKTFIPKWFKLILHGENREDLFKQIPSSALPAEFGGSLEGYSLNNDHLLGCMKDYLKKVKEEQKYFYAEA